MNIYGGGIAMNYENSIEINRRKISLETPTYFIADVASNHDGDLERAKKLIRLASEAGADAVKFQHFLAADIVSDFGFKHLGTNASHQNKWRKPVFDVYKKYECPREWTHELAAYAEKQKIDFFSTPYDYAAVDLFESIAPAYKIGSGDICWIDFLEYIALKGKPVILSTGASSLNDVQQAVTAIVKYNPRIALLQCNTNYTGDSVNLKYSNLNVLRQYARLYPGMVLGLSDHTCGHVTVLGAIALGARIIEKHFTDDCGRIGPDHAFSMDPTLWREMVENSRELEAALGDGEKKIEENEKDSYIVQRRCLRVNRDLHPGDLAGRDVIDILRPCPPGSIQPSDINRVLCKKVRNEKKAGDALYLSDFGG
jgi:sialic acid synthase SpsE